VCKSGASRPITLLHPAQGFNMLCGEAYRGPPTRRHCWAPLGSPAHQAHLKEPGPATLAK
jgi:hypothetical protein